MEKTERDFIEHLTGLSTSALMALRKSYLFRAERMEEKGLDSDLVPLVNRLDFIEARILFRGITSKSTVH